MAPGHHGEVREVGGAHQLDRGEEHGARRDDGGQPQGGRGRLEDEPGDEPQNDDITTEQGGAALDCLEPVWAIGVNGIPADSDYVAERHAGIRRILCARFGEEQGSRIPILYGGSVNPQNAQELIALTGCRRPLYWTQCLGRLSVQPHHTPGHAFIHE